MPLRLSVVSVLALVAAATSAVLAVLSVRHRGKRMALQFCLLEVSLAVWSLAYAVQLGYGTLGEQLVWQRATLAVAGWIPTAWLLFTVAYTNRESWLGRRRVAALAAEPVAWSLLCLTNPDHGLVWTGATLTGTVFGPVPALDFGVGYAVHIAYAYGIVAAGLALLVVHATRLAPAYQKQIALLVAGVVPPFLAHVLFTLGLSPVPGLDLTPFAFAVTGVVFGLALFEFDLLHLRPIAREQAFEEVGDGLLIVNSAGEVVDVVGVAADVFSPTPAIGDRASTVLPAPSLEALDGTELSATVAGERRVYDCQVSPLSARHDQQAGSLVIVRDVTGLHESRQRLSVSNRVLRHNLRNDMNVVLGYASDLEARLDGDDAADARRIGETVEQFLGLAEKAERIADVDEESGDGGATVDIARCVRDVVADQRAAGRGATFTVEVSGEPVVDGVDPEGLHIAVRNVVDNAVRHTDTATPDVHVAVREAPDETRIEVSDDGPGIPDVERDAVGASVETALEHSQGLGLWLTYWCVTNWGGDLRFDADGGGTTVTITVPSSAAAGSDGADDPET